MGGVVVVYDIGKTNVKLMGFDAASGAEVWSRFSPNAPRQDDLYPCADVERLEAFLIDGLADAARMANGVIDGIVVTTHGASGALLAGEQLALPVLDYEYDGPEETSDDYATLRPSFAETFSPRLPAGLNLGAQLFWLQRRFAERFLTATTFVTYPQLWAFKLCGVAATEVTSLGCHTDLWAPGQDRFSSLVTAANWRGLMAPARRAGDVLGPMRPELAQYLGLKASPRVFCGLQDSNASLVPYLADTTPRSILSSGTWAILFALGGSLARLDEARDTCANVNVCGDPVLTARFMGGREFDTLTGGATATPSAQELNRVLEARLMALPGFAPGCGPFPHARGRWTVAPETLTPGERQVVASLYLALMSHFCLDLIGASGDTVVAGPFVENALFCDALATLTQRPLVRAHGTTATGAGAARLLLPDLPSEAGSSASGLAAALHPALAAYAVQWTALSSA
jgi:sugar (pentulose or hexulose) kinase